MYWPQDTVTTTPYDIPDTKRVFFVDASGGARVLNLPDAAGKAALYFIIKKTDTSTNSVTINPPVGKTIDGFSSYVLTVVNQIIGVTSDASGNYFIVDGNMSGTATGQGRQALEKTDANFTLGTSFAAVTGMTISLNLDTAGTVIIHCSGTFNKGSQVSIARAAIGVEVDGVQYSLADTNINNGSGGDNNNDWGLSGCYGIFLTAGVHTIKLIALGNGAGTVLLGAASTPATLAVLYPTITTFGGGSPTGDPTRDLSGTWSDTLVVGLQGDPLPTKIPKGYLKRNNANSAWLLDPTIMSFQKAGVLKSFGRQTINFEDVTNFSTEVIDDITNDRVNVRFSGQGGGGGGGGGISVADALLLKTYFSDQGFMPSNIIREDLYTYPAPDFTNLNGGTLARSSSKARFAASSAPANWGWDMGAAKSKVLFIMGGMRVDYGTGQGMGLFVSSALPSTSELPDGGYLSWSDLGAGHVVLYKANAFTEVGTKETQLHPAITTDTVTFGFALYYDDATNRLIVFMRFGAETWIPVIDATDSSFTTMRYVGVRQYNTGAGIVQWTGCPLAIYAE